MLSYTVHSLTGVAVVAIDRSVVSDVAGDVIRDVEVSRDEVGDISCIELVVSIELVEASVVTCDVTAVISVVTSGSVIGSV